GRGPAVRQPERVGAVVPLELGDQLFGRRLGREAGGHRVQARAVQVQRGVVAGGAEVVEQAGRREHRVNGWGRRRRGGVRGGLRAAARVRPGGAEGGGRALGGGDVIRGGRAPALAAEERGCRDHG